MSEAIPAPEGNTILEALMLAANEQIKASLDENAVKLFRATVYGVYPEGEINIMREHNELPDGSNVPDNVPVVAVNLALPLEVGDTIYCFSSGGQTYVWGKVYEKGVDQTIAELKAEHANDIAKLADRIKKLEEQVNTPNTGLLADAAAFRQFQTNAVGASGAGGWRQDLWDAIGNKAGKTHQHPWDEVDHPTDLSHAGHNHGWKDLPNKGVHDNDQHSPDYIPRKEAENTFSKKTHGPKGHG